jgi:hypothetical protein
VSINTSASQQPVIQNLAQQLPKKEETVEERIKRIRQKNNPQSAQDENQSKKQQYLQ